MKIFVDLFQGEFVYSNIFKMILYIHLKKLSHAKLYSACKLNKKI